MVVWRRGESVPIIMLRMPFMFFGNFFSECPSPISWFKIKWIQVCFIKWIHGSFLATLEREMFCFFNSIFGYVLYPSNDANTILSWNFTEIIVIHENMIKWVVVLVMVCVEGDRESISIIMLPVLFMFFDIFFLECAIPILWFKIKEIQVCFITWIQILINYSFFYNINIVMFLIYL